MQSTGPIESWNINPTEVGQMYPFAGWELLMFAVCAAFCAAFMVWKFASERAKYAKQVQKLRTPDDFAKTLDIECKDPLE